MGTSNSFQTFSSTFKLISSIPVRQSPQKQFESHRQTQTKPKPNNEDYYLILVILLWRICCQPTIIATSSRIQRGRKHTCKSSTCTSNKPRASSTSPSSRSSLTKHCVTITRRTINDFGM